ncbi:MAG: type II secretion system F family protein [Pseudomonadales bacterium]|nr:type II secretion system F family protein [Pseudomonadales bacterium]
MPEFSYSARSGDARISGKRLAGSASMLAAELSREGLIPLTIDPIQQAGRRIGAQLARRSVSLSELIVFSHQMASLAKAGISIVKAVHTLAESSKNPTMADTLTDVAAGLEAGLDFASCLGRHRSTFSELYINVVHIGENTGRMDDAFQRIAKYLELERETRRRIQAATRYPMFVLCAISVAIVVLNIFVIPAFATVFSKYGAALPWQTQAIIAVSDFFVAYWHVLGLLLVVALVAAIRSMRNAKFRILWHQWQLRIPILGSILERIYLTRFCQSFAMVSRSGVPIVQGLHVVSRAVGNDFMAGRIDEMRVSIERGESITATARSAQLFSPVVLQMMAVGEETGTMDDLLEQAASFYEEEVEYELKGLTDALEPLLIIGIAILVLFMALGVFLPLWDLNSVAH